jgi:C2H2 type zinc finger protein
MSNNCSVCGASFGSPATLVEHTRSAHPHPDASESLAMNPEAESPGLVCGLCGKRFDSAAALSEHNLSRPERRREALRASAGKPGSG